MWSAIELNMAVVCACLMIVKPLIARLFPQIFMESLEAETDSLGYVLSLHPQMRPELFPDSRSSRPATVPPLVEFVGGMSLNGSTVLYKPT
jgi:hypothetical protein